MSEPARVTLSDQERSRIRWSSGKRGYVGRVEFYPGPRGGRYRSHRTDCFPQRERARLALLGEYGRYRQSVSKLLLRTVDHLGRVLETEDVTDQARDALRARSGS